MSVRYLLDTNTSSYIIKRNFPNVVERLRRVPMAQIGISVVTEAELLFGVARLPKALRLKEGVEEFLIRVDVQPWTSAAARQYASIRATLENQGEPMGNLDMMIAAHALATNTVLVTHDRVFRRLKRLTIEDWTRASSG